MLLRGRGICGGLLRPARRVWTGIFPKVDSLEPGRILATDLVLVRSISLYSQERFLRGATTSQKPQAGA